ncbi:MAG: hypothetical protein PHS12_04250, partial [Candidatus Omnitrophica bacterium]|nr:hypothetical protein [Candidatus Omnitrophota bacterium]
INDADILEIDLASGLIKNITQNQEYKTEGFPEFLRELVQRGGLMNYIKYRQQGTVSQQDK